MVDPDHSGEPSGWGADGFRAIIVNPDHPGLVLHGETEVKKRKELVRCFQEDEAVGFFVLSLKAGGAGLNLTAASRVAHFDSMVESGGGEPGDRPRLSHWPDQERAGA
jgi:hypothetical protein